MPRVAFLLGAGASFPYGIPMMTEMYTGFVEYVRTKRPHCESLLRLIEKGIPMQDIESLISNLDKIRSIREGMRVLGKIDRDLVPHVDVADELRGYLDSYLVEVCERFDVHDVGDKLSGFIEFCRENSSFVFSTNYDRLIETAASHHSIPCTDGFEQSSSRPESRWDGVFEEHEGLKLIKLHGSVNWYREEESDAIFRLERGYSLPSHEYRLTHGRHVLRPLMIIPTLEKAVLDSPYSSLLTTFSDGLKMIDVLFIVGNSMRDAHIRNTIGVRKSGLDIVLVNPDCESQVTVFGGSVEVHLLPIGTQEFMGLGVQMLGSWVRDIGKFNGSEERKLAVAEFVKELGVRAQAQVEMSAGERRLVHRIGVGGSEERVELMKSVRRGVHQEVIETLREVLRKGASDAEQVAAIDALAELVDTGSIDVLSGVVGGNAAVSVRAEAALALKRISEVGGVDVSDELTRMSRGDRVVETLLG